MIRSLFLLVLLSLVYSCSITKRVRIEKVFEIRVDTIVKIVRDTGLKKNEGRERDTVYVENSIAVARTYIDAIKGVRVIDLRGKIFDVKIEGIRKSTVKEVVGERKRKGKVWLVGLVGCVALGLVLYLRVRK